MGLSPLSLLIFDIVEFVTDMGFIEVPCKCPLIVALDFDRYFLAASAVRPENSIN